MKKMSVFDSFSYMCLFAAPLLVILCGRGVLPFEWVSRGSIVLFVLASILCAFGNFSARER